MAEREIILEQMLKVLKDIETNTCDKQFFPDTKVLEKKLDHLVSLHEKEIEILNAMSAELVSALRAKKKKEKKDKKLW